MSAPDLAAIRILACDVDGVLTDGGLYYGPRGEEWKRFEVRDGVGVALAHHGGLLLAFVSGRPSGAVEARARELGIAEVHLGVADKVEVLRGICARHGCGVVNVAYVGDDITDLPALDLVGYPITVPEAPEEVRARVRYVTRSPGGHGALREVVGHILEGQGRLGSALRDYLGLPAATGEGMVLA